MNFVAPWATGGSLENATDATVDESQIQDIVLDIAQVGALVWSFRELVVLDGLMYPQHIVFSVSFREFPQTADIYNHLSICDI